MTARSHTRSRKNVARRMRKLAARKRQARRDSRTKNARAVPHRRGEDT